jgi:hypothetical protein
MMNYEWPKPFQDGYNPYMVSFEHPSQEELDRYRNGAAVRVRAARCIRRTLGIQGHIPVDQLVPLLRVAKKVLARR